MPARQSGEGETENGLLSQNINEIIHDIRS